MRDISRSPRSRSPRLRWPRSRRPWSRGLAALGLLAGLGGCALSDQAEGVHLQQHRASTALTDAILAAESSDPDLAEHLYVVEAAFAKSCARLREAASRRLNNQPSDADHMWAVYRSLDGCSARTQEVERLLRVVDPESAAYFLDSPNLATVPPEE